MLAGDIRNRSAAIYALAEITRDNKTMSRILTDRIPVNALSHVMNVPSAFRFLKWRLEGSGLPLCIDYHSSSSAFKRISRPDPWDDNVAQPRSRRIRALARLQFPTRRRMSFAELARRCSDSGVQTFASRAPSRVRRTSSRNGVAPVHLTIETGLITESVNTGNTGEPGTSTNSVDPASQSGDAMAVDPQST
ncbi:unnamed protein product [Rhizoctonia solani]|uniref:Uncharacterized protein n=1 Tax=Rhizoctonia solani TaxID=456999 RepID=A0A8H2XHT9_9AGAM|nr:unnamed protein product [Rhizoctonia solani]CAE6518695.1 unnamed protein product [Rhizoctonia solani]